MHDSFDMVSDAVRLFILFGGLQGIFLGLVHLIKQPRLPWDRPMALLLLTFAPSNVFLWLLNWRGAALVDDQQLMLIRLVLLLPLNPILPPVYFLFTYVRQFTRLDGSFKQFTTLLKWTAVAEILLYLLPFGAALYTSTIDKPLISFSLTIRRVINLISIPFGLSAAIFMGQLLKRHRRYLAQQLPRQSTYRLRWLQLLLLAFVVVFALVTAPLLLRYVFHVPGLWSIFLQGGVASVVLIWMSVNSLLIDTRIVLADQQPLPTSEDLVPASARQRIYEQALQLLADEHLYRRPTLKVSDLAERLDLTPNYLSRIINQEGDKNFNDLLNDYRVAEVKRLLDDPAFGHYTLESIGREAGFNAKSTFQAVFKKNTGLTPSQYKDKRKDQ